ncbi:cobalamin biosynthesis protein CobW [Ruania suaedae]|uniref:cobalamin biosynthesis protein CobW n=1 Tax=Ruania suaedae TaxID=2897774 RepID=UPI001E58171B|nr:cobalamin biosynthesis protein CobW [Ruania suaedae]UFU02662.1 cobalamin biosynthesis protein CobW [Ruania suaedae]
MSEPVRPVAVLATIDPVDREIALLSALADRPDVPALVHDITIDQGTSRLRRRVLRGQDVVEDEWVELEHVCPSCAVREDAGPTVARLVREPGVTGVLLALPPGAELLPATAGLTGALAAEDAPGVVAAGICCIAAEVLPGALLGEEEAGERGIALAPEDDRAVAEVVLGQLPPADLVVLDGGARGRGRDLADALRRHGSDLVADIHADWLTGALGMRHDLAHAEAHLHATSASPGVGAAAARVDEHGWQSDASDVWTLDLHTPVALHPGRLLAQIDAVANGPRVIWGRFWVPNRPDSVCGLYGGGRQISVGVADEWGQQECSTRWLVVGAGPGREEVLAAFERAVLTSEETAAGLLPWLDRADPLEPYLGARST